ncbi:MAG TPA: hypothetical protein VF556_01145 [Pyrinomonadaceae bacterium]|jgi:hypothetical protein
MKTLSEKQALLKLHKLKSELQDFVRCNYEQKAKSCLTCDTKGACCLDAHFVNVHITRLEAVSIRNELNKFSVERQREIYSRVEKTIERYNLGSTGDTFLKAFACPLFEKEAGCLVHLSGKPAPCVLHACYENKEDLPPDELQTEAESQIEKLNEQTYKIFPQWLPLPVWLSLMNPFKRN